MVHTQTVCCTAPAVRPQRTKKLPKMCKKPESSVEKKVIPEKPWVSICGDTLTEPAKEAQIRKSDEFEGEPKEERKVPTLVEYLKAKQLEERLAKKKQAEEERERFMKEAAERKAAERDDIIKRAKKLIFYRKQTCRRLNQGLLISECLRELDAQIKFRDTLKNVDKDEDMTYANMIKADAEKYEEELKQKAEKQIEARRMYAVELKKQIEDNRAASIAKEDEDYEAEKEDQINMKKRLEDIREYEAQQLMNKKERLKHFFRDAIEEKRRFNLKLKSEDEFEDRVNEIYRGANERIKKLQKSMTEREREDRDRLIAERALIYVKPKTDSEEWIYEKVVEENERNYQEKQRIKKECEEQMRKERRDYHAAMKAAKLKQIREEKDLRAWETLQLFKKIEHDKEWEADERKRAWNGKMEWAKALKEDINERETHRSPEKIADEQAAELTKKMMEKENQRVLDYAEELLKESEGVRPLYPILRAVQDCKKEMGLIAPRKKVEVIDPVPKRRCRIPPKCKESVPEDKILYL